MRFVSLSLIPQVLLLLLLLLLLAGWPARTVYFRYSASVRFVCSSFGFESLEDAEVFSTGELHQRRKAEGGTKCTTTTTAAAAAAAAAGTSLGKLPPTAQHADGNNMCLGSMHYSLHRSYRESYRGA